MEPGKEHMHGLAKVLCQFQQTGYLCDTVLVAEDGLVKAHSAVLAATSQVLRASLKADNKPQQHVLIFPGVELFIVNCVVRFMYTGDTMIHDSEIGRLPEILAILRELGLEASRPAKPCCDSQERIEAVMLQDGSSQSTSVPNSSLQIPFNTSVTTSSWSTIPSMSQNAKQTVQIAGDIGSCNAAITNNSFNLIGCAAKIHSVRVASTTALPISYSNCSLDSSSASVVSTAASAIPPNPISSTTSRRNQCAEIIRLLNEDCPQLSRAKVTSTTPVQSVSETVPVLDVCGTLSSYSWPVLASTCLVFYEPRANLGSLMSTAMVSVVSTAPATNLKTCSALKSFRSIRPATTPSGILPPLSASASTVVSSVSLAASSFSNNFMGSISSFASSEMSSAAPLSCNEERDHFEIKMDPDGSCRLVSISNYDCLTEPAVDMLSGHAWRPTAADCHSDYIKSEPYTKSKEVDHTTEMRSSFAGLCYGSSLDRNITEDVAQRCHSGELSAGEVLELRRRGLISPSAGGPHPDGQEVYCSSCGFNHSQVFVHKMRGPQLCEFCGLISPTCGTHVGHVASHRRDALKQDVIKRRFSCEFCGKTFAFENSLNRHMRCHSAAGPSTYVCDQCEKVFTTDANRRHHMLVRHGVEYVSSRCKPAEECHICKRRFRCPANLRQHMRTHTGERPFACAVCPMRFMTRQTLQLHANGHSGATPYACRECGRAFAQPSSYYAHMKRFHKGAKASLTGACVSVSKLSM